MIDITFVLIICIHRELANLLHRLSIKPCADPESFARGGPTRTTFFFVFFLIRGKRSEIALKVGHHQPASETPFKWRYAGVPMMAKH